MNERHDYYVYELIDPLNNFQPFYVGKGRGYRVVHHYTPKYLERKCHKSRVIQRYRQEGMKDQYVIVSSGLTELESFSIESKLIGIAGYKRTGGLLVNISGGGEGSSGCNQPKTFSHRQAISEAKKGKPLSKAHREALSKAKKGIIKMSEETRRKISASLKGRPTSEEHRKNLSLSQKGKSKKRK